MVFVISVVSVLSTNPALNPHVCGSPNLLHCFHDSLCLRESPRVQNIGLANHSQERKGRGHRCFAQISQKTLCKKTLGADVLLPT